MSGFEDSAGLNVSNWYGPRSTGKTGGVFDTDGFVKEAVIVVKAADIGSDSYQPIILPAGAKVVGAYAKVSEAFALGGTTPVINIGTSGSEATNGVNLTEAQAEAVGTYDLIGTNGGTWAAALAAATTVKVVLGGTTPTVGSAGVMTVVIRYSDIASQA